MALVVDPAEGTGGRWVPRRGPNTFADAGYCSRSFNQGLLRFHDSATGPVFRELLFEAFPELREYDRKADVLAFDWHGCQYLTAKIKGEGELMVLKADLGIGQVEPWATAPEFAALLKLDEIGEAFNVGVYDQWREAAGMPEAQLPFTDCVEFTVPLYLGGAQTLENLQLIDLDVSWTIGAQLRSQTRDLPEGTSVQIDFGE